MIKSVDISELELVAKYAYKLNSIPQHKCKALPRDYESILKQFERMIKHPYDELLISTDGDDVLGLLALLVEPEDKYLEFVGGVFAEDNFDAIGEEFFKYIKGKYKGYHLDAAYPEENVQAIGFMESIGAKLIDFNYEYRINKDDFKSLYEVDNVIYINEKYNEDFINLHNRMNPDAYWTGEKLINALDKFDIFLALEDDKVIGSIVTSKFNKKVDEIYFISVEKGKENLHLEKALLNRGISHAFSNGNCELILMIAKEDIKMLNICEELGFRKTDTCLTYSLDI